MAEWAAIFNADFEESGSTFDASFNETDRTFGADFDETQIVHTDDYNELFNKPQINGVELKGDKSFEELGDNPLTNIEIKEMFNNIFGQ